MPNIGIIKLILEYLGKTEDLIQYVKDRPGHDRRYAIDSTKIQTELDWKPSFTFEEAIGKSIDWYLQNKSWWERIISGEYQKYYTLQYHIEQVINLNSKVLKMKKYLLLFTLLFTSLIYCQSEEKTNNLSSYMGVGAISVTIGGDFMLQALIPH